MTTGGVLDFRGVLKGHKAWVTSLATAWPHQDSPSAPTVIASGSRDNSIIIWHVNPEGADAAKGLAGVPVKSLLKHKQPVSDIVLSTYGDYLLSTSWDKSMRLWDVNSGESFRNFTGHTSDVFSVALSADNRQIVSCGRDKTIRLWNTLGQQKHTLTESQHTDWISQVRFSPEHDRALVVSCGWDRLTKVWDLKAGSLLYDFCGHTGPVKAVTISPDGSLCASGDSDGWVMLWDVVEGSHLYSLEGNAPVNSLCFSPCNYWLCAATEQGIKIWDLEHRKPISDIRIQLCPPESPVRGVQIVDQKKYVNKQVVPLAELDGHPNPSNHLPWCTSLVWSPEGDYLYAGSNNGNIYVFGLKKRN